MSSPLHGKIAFITGASRGIGQACAIALAQAGAHCILSARTQSGLMRTDDIIRAMGGETTLLPLDLGTSDPKQYIDPIGPSIAAQYNQLDIFIHAAFQYMPLTPITQIVDSVWDKNLKTNLTNCRYLIRTLSPLLCATPNAHTIFLQNTVEPEAFWGPVAIVQAALKTMVLCWKAEVTALSSVKIDLFTPPPTNTVLRQTFFPAENKDALSSPKEVAKQIISLILSQK
ncbi:SDR family NAD(P)-dependent oxidoreductase [Commensalibacter oyaizuii]|uniref:SDR family NAD(P)-dependent oxidoreductase n=1 Tax=Commensalibacter oyaizuii TaxID=3043873 RepID=A0ABT6Q3T1_9PROT|nr:SDR family NAD(P)-dependent oxidoreductase [Commensalibacter sp. TBRC 16381]MDI2091763.1 SDR family NAD(P)-dependent oxidoreductase [Commensalibacter sp. TBRC 16381]